MYLCLRSNLLYISQLYIQNIVKTTIMLNVKIIFQENDFFKTFVPCVLYIMYNIQIIIKKFNLDFKI